MVELLQNTIANNSKKLTFQLDIHQLTDETIHSLEQHLASFKGDKQLFFSVYDAQNELKLSLNSRKQKVRISRELLELLNAENWHYKLN